MAMAGFLKLILILNFEFYCCFSPDSSGNPFSFCFIGLSRDTKRKRLKRIAGIASNKKPVLNSVHYLIYSLNNDATTFDNFFFCNG